MQFAVLKKIQKQVDITQMIMQKLKIKQNLNEK